MHGFRVRSLLLCALTATGIFANDARKASDFKDNLFDVVKSSAPLFVFNNKDACLPTAAVLNNDQDQPNPGGSGQCVTKHPTSGSGSVWEISPKFPTYYYVNKCDYGNGDVQYRILYDLYIPQDTYHTHDWEYAVVVWKRRSDGMFERDSIFLEQHGSRQYLKWNDIPHTVESWADKDTTGRRNANHPKLYVEKVGHPIRANNPALTACPSGNRQSECLILYGTHRSGAWTASWLKNGITNLPDRDWGSADSPPHAFQPGRHRDICWNM